MAEKRRKFFQRARQKHEARDRLSRIAAAAPPASTVDGQLQRWKDRKNDEAGLEDEPLVVDVDADDLSDVEDLADAGALETEDEAATAPPPPLRSKHYKPGHRQTEKPKHVRGEKSWWEQLPREGATKMATEQQERMRKSKVRVPDRMLAEDAS